MVNLVFNALPGPHTDDGYLTLHSLNVLLHYIGRKRFLDLEHTSAVAEVMVSVLGKVYRQISFLLLDNQRILNVRSHKYSAYGEVGEEYFVALDDRCTILFVLL
ncbi:hypothetical protein MPTK1_5g11880 [Marchantia polymorpha subsp. ruderalis]|uniref:Uncharacterized protein n=2 Tax=Marchantia polymorpha TaxID=3197 RepID=A0AAF6BHF4_MARPO|nr:hypothetical protein MARPO_0143s0016 [Marchantia polymorpha]BBN11438.1 hypothetical protein Mp_5g11880 [Marchantia polymorpha subsp. ruderalis]|eukprot:PTQ29336.1 hypothetical protein MARPO_0143s0016 [Marchantia polymorpha]